MRGLDIFATMNWVQKAAIFCLLVLFAAGIGRLWYCAKGGFAIRRIGAAIPAEQETAPFSEEWFQGPFRYLGRGRQCYAFESPDRRFVLKIPRFDRYELPFVWKLPFSFLEKKREMVGKERKKRQAFLLHSFEIAASELKEETALLYLHLHDTGALLGKTTLIDKLGRRYEIDLNRVVFALQEKKALMMPQFLAAVRSRDDTTVDQIFKAFLAILKKQASLGIFNKDPWFIKNFAWEEGGEGVQIDIGGFYRKEGMEGDIAFFSSMQESVGPIREWLSAVDPALLSRFDRQMEEVYRNELKANF